MAAMFEGFSFFEEFSHTIDSQRRVAIPADWRVKDSETRFVLLPAREGILYGIPSRTFHDEIIAKAKKMSLANSRDLRDLAALGSRAQECICDKQGRIQISQRLMDHAGLRDKVVLVGAIWMIQLWTPEKWEASQSSAGSEFYDVMGRLGDGSGGQS